MLNDGPVVDGGKVDSVRVVSLFDDEERLQALNFYGGKLNTAGDVQEVYELTLDAMEQIFGFEYAAFLITKRSALEVAAQRGYSAPLSLELPLNGTKRGITVKAAMTRRPALVVDVSKDEDYVEGIAGIQSELAVPVETEDRLLGILNVESTKLEAFYEKDATLLQILASHSATAIRNIERRDEIQKRSNQLALLMKSSAEMIRSTDVRQRLEKIAEAIRELGWRRVVMSVRDDSLNIAKPDDIVTAGLTDEETEFLWTNKQPGEVWEERFGLEFERFKLGEFFYLPWSDPWVRQRFSEGTVSSHLKPEDMVDWDPEDLLYAPLRLAEGRIVGVLSIDDPQDGRRPTKESLAPLELFIYQAAVAIENAKLIQQLKHSREELRRYSEDLEDLVEERTRDLEKSEEELKSIFSASPDPIMVTDLKGNIIECNEQALKINSCSSKNEFIGKNALEYVAERDRSKVLEILKKTLEQGLVKNLEYTFLTNDGREFPGELSASVIRDASSRPESFVAVFKDITDRKRLEEQLLKSERLAAIGEVAAMIGHDLRNPLTGIAGATYYLKMKFGENLGSRAKEMLDLIEKDIDYSNKIICDLLDYSREMRLELTCVDPRSVLETAFSLVEVPRNIRVLTRIQNKLRVRMDAGKMARVFVNMIKNAFDAMPDGGRLTIRISEKKENLEITVADTGTGMPKEVTEKIGTPLFTTKAKGIGLGLPICKRIVEAHGGVISVESVVGKGTKFTLSIPIIDLDGGEESWKKEQEFLLSTMTRA